MGRGVIFLVCCVVVGLAAALPASAATKRLRAFDSCMSLVRYAQQHTPARAPHGPVATTDAPTPAAAPEAQEKGTADDVSGTNVQEAGVDEPDVVKSDGRHLLAIANGTLHAVDARAATPKLVGSLELPPGYGHELLVRHGRALVIQSGEQAVTLPKPNPIAGPEPRPGVMPVDLLPTGPPTTVLTELDVSDPAAMKVVASMTFEGSPVSARLTGETARVVASSSPILYAGAEGARDSTRGWIPTAKLAGPVGTPRGAKRLVPCRSVRRPPRFAGSGLLSILTVDLAKGLPAVDADALMTDAQTVYASPRSLYVATQRWHAGPSADTTIHQFDAAERGVTTYRASGTVAGHLLNQFSLSEHDGVLRAATTQDGAASESYVTTLKPEGGQLVALGRVGGLGVTERIYAVRFIGDVGYVVTFRQTDPLYTLDLSKPAEPRVAGELKILGYSAYLHPVGDGLLLGVGRDATEDGRVKGAQLSLFDVSDPARPTRVAQRTLSQFSSTEAEWDHHAFLWWPATRLAVLPVSEQAFDGAIGFRVERGGVDEVGRIAPERGSVRRTTVVGERLFSLSDAGVAVSALGDLAAQGWIAFPGPPDRPVPVPERVPGPAG